MHARSILLSTREFNMLEEWQKEIVRKLGEEIIGVVRKLGEEIIEVEIKGIIAISSFSSFSSLGLCSLA